MSLRPDLPIRQDVGAEVDLLQDRLSQHHGWLAPLVIRWLLAHQDEWPRLRAEYERVREQVRARARGGPGGRAAHVVGLLASAAMVLREAAPELTWNRVPLLEDGQIMDVLRQGISHVQGSSAKAADIYDVLISVFEANRSRFWASEKARKERQPTAGWLGRYDGEADRNGRVWIDFSPDQFDELVRRHVRDLESTKQIRRNLHERGLFRINDPSKVRWKQRGEPGFYSVLAQESADDLEEDQAESEAIRAEKGGLL